MLSRIERVCREKGLRMTGQRRVAAQQYRRDVTDRHLFDQQPSLDERHWAHVVSDIEGVNYFILPPTCTSVYKIKS